MTDHIVISCDDPLVVPLDDRFEVRVVRSTPEAALLFSLVRTGTGEVPPGCADYYPDLDAAYKAYVELPDTSRPENGVEITGMLTVFTGHLHPDTYAALLGHDGKSGPDDWLVAVYRKGPFGWIIYPADDAGDLDGLPDDLRGIMAYAANCRCGVVCVDSDGPITDGLPLYWNGKPISRKP